MQPWKDTGVLSLNTYTHYLVTNNEHQNGHQKQVHETQNTGWTTVKSCDVNDCKQTTMSNFGQDQQLYATSTQTVLHVLDNIPALNSKTYKHVAKQGSTEQTFVEQEKKINFMFGNIRMIIMIILHVLQKLEMTLAIFP